VREGERERERERKLKAIKAERCLLEATIISRGSIKFPLGKLASGVENRSPVHPRNFALLITRACFRGNSFIFEIPERRQSSNSPDDRSELPSSRALHERDLASCHAIKNSGFSNETTSLEILLDDPLEQRSNSERRNRKEQTPCRRFRRLPFDHRS